MTIRFATCHFLLVVLRNRADVSNGFRVYLGHDIELSYEYFSWLC